MGLLREFVCPLDGKKMAVMDLNDPPSKAMGREFIAVRCKNKNGGHIWMVSERTNDYILMRQKMGRD